MKIDFDPNDRKQLLAVYEMILTLTQIQNPNLVVKWLVPKPKDSESDDRHS